MLFLHCLALLVNKLTTANVEQMGERAAGVCETKTGMELECVPY